MGRWTTIRWGTLAFALLASPALASDQPPVPQIVVVGTAIIKATPDQAFVNLAVESRDAKPLKAQQANAVAMDAVMKKLAAAGFAKDAIKTLSYDLQEEFDYHEGKRIARGYIARNMIEVEVDQIDRVGEVIDVAASAGATSVSSVRFDLKERDAVEREALKQAVADAKARAQAAADGAGARLGRLLKIEQQGAGFEPPRPMVMAKMAMAAESAQDTSISPGELEISATVTLAAAIE